MKRFYKTYRKNCNKDNLYVFDPTSITIEIKVYIYFYKYIIY